jgi:hypothetical protein
MDAEGALTILAPVVTRFFRGKPGVHIIAIEITIDNLLALGSPEVVLS